MEILLILVCLQAFNLVLFFFKSSQTPFPNFYLISLFGAISVHMFFKIGLFFFAPDGALFEKLHSGFSFLYGPIMWLYVRQINDPSKAPRIVILHFIPFIVSLLSNLIFLVLLWLRIDILPFLNQIEPFFLSFLLGSNTFYSVSSFLLLRKVWRNQSFEFLAAKWITLVFMALSCLMIWQALMGEEHTISEFSFRIIFYLVFLTMFVGILILKYRSPFQNVLALNQEQAISPTRSTGKYKNYQLDEENLDQVLASMIRYFESSKPFKNPDYSLDDLASELGVSKLKLTQALNLKLGKNFYQVINQARAEESRRLMEEAGSNNLLGVGFDSGFKSKSTFYKYFKEEFGVSPGDFKKSRLQC
jgi:AraC-like DNA-binding protein